MNDSFEVHATDDDNHLPLSITHARDTIIHDGRVEQDYRFLVYTFAGSAGDIVARTYFDDALTVSILQPTHGEAINDPVLTYLQRRFSMIKQLGGPDGYAVIWKAAK